MHVNPTKKPYVCLDPELLDLSFPIVLSPQNISAYISERLRRDIIGREYFIVLVNSLPVSRALADNPEGYAIIEEAIITSILDTIPVLNFSQLGDLPKVLNKLIEDHWLFFRVMNHKFSSVTSIEGEADLSPAQLRFYANFKRIADEHGFKIVLSISS